MAKQIPYLSTGDLNPNTMTTKEELDEAIAHLAGVFIPDSGAVETALTIITKYRDGQLVEKGQWISVKDRPLLLPDEGDTWEITDEGSCTFLAHIEIENNGRPEQFIAWCYIREGTIDLCYVGDDEDTGWSATDVQNYILMPLPTPPTNQTEKP